MSDPQRASDPSTVSASAATATPISSTAMQERRAVQSVILMPLRMRDRRVRLKSPSVASVAFRLHQLHGDSSQTWEHRMTGDASCYRHVARMNRELRSAGLYDRVAACMAPVDASVAEGGQDDAEYRVERAAAEEYMALAEYRERPCFQTARALLRKRAARRHASLDDDARIAKLHGMTL